MPNADRDYTAQPGGADPQKDARTNPDRPSPVAESPSGQVADQTGSEQPLPIGPEPDAAPAGDEEDGGWVSA